MAIKLTTGALWTASLRATLFSLCQPGIAASAGWQLPPAYPPRGYDDVPAERRALWCSRNRCMRSGSTGSALGVLDSGQGPVTADGTLRNGYFFPVTYRALELLRGQSLETVSEAADEGGEHNEPFEGYVGGPATGWRSWRSGQSSVFCGTSSCGAGQLVALCGRSSRKNYSSRHISSPARPVRRTSEWTHETCPCSLVCSAAMRSLSSAILSSVSRGSSNVAAAVPSKLRTRIRDIVGLRLPAYSEKSRRYFAWHRRRHSAKRGK